MKQDCLLTHTARDSPSPLGDGGICQENQLTGTLYRGLGMRRQLIPPWGLQGTLLPHLDFWWDIYYTRNRKPVTSWEAEFAHISPGTSTHPQALPQSSPIHAV